MEWMNSARGLTGKSLPLNSYSMMLCRISRPMEPFFVEAPITATDLGAKMASSDDTRRPPRSGGAEVLLGVDGQEAVGDPRQILDLEADVVARSARRDQDLLLQEVEVGLARHRLPRPAPEPRLQPASHRREVLQDGVQRASRGGALNADLEGAEVRRGALAPPRAGTAPG